MTWLVSISIKFFYSIRPGQVDKAITKIAKKVMLLQTPIHENKYIADFEVTKNNNAIESAIFDGPMTLNIITCLAMHPFH